MKTLAFILFLFSALKHNIALGQENNFIYNSETLQIQQISPNTFVHISYLNTEDFGKVDCNGMIVISEGEALVFDTPASEEASVELINWLENEKGIEIKGVVATHFHWDCVGGLDEFHAQGIPSYASDKTIAFAKAAGNPVPENGFEGQLTLKVGAIQVENRFFGEGHTRDNFVSYVPSDQVLFGGCLVKSLAAGKGNLEDANVNAWPATMDSILKNLQDIAVVIPGHGAIGDRELLAFTRALFAKP